jgi:5-dehydro-2-deoxygluconokinase
VVTHPDDKYATRIAQEESLLQLLHACRNTGRELMIQIEFSKGQNVTSKTLAQIVERFLVVGIYADWWQLPIPLDERPYAHLERVIEQHDPHSLGIILQCNYTKISQMKVAFEFARGTHWCKGFILSESSFNDVIHQWRKNDIANHTLVEMVAQFYTDALTVWHDCFSDKVVKEQEAQTI